MAFALTVAALASLAARGSFAAVLAVDPPERVFLVEELSEALCPLHREGVRGRALVHLGERPVFHSPVLDSVAGGASLRVLLQGADCAQLKERVSGPARADALWTAENFALAAHGLGVIRELWWVVPTKDSLTAERFEGFLGWLRETSALPAAFADSLRFEDRAASGTHRGLTVHIVALADLPAIEGPAILAVDTDFLERLHENPVREGMVGLLAGFVATLRARALQGSHVVVAPGTGTPLRHRYLASRIGDLLRDPRRFESAPPESWGLQDRFEYLSFLAATGEARAAAERLAELEPGSPAAWYDLATLAVAEEKPGEAARLLAEATRADPGYVAGYRSLAGELIAQGMDQEGLELLREGRQRHPRDIPTALALADVLAARGDGAGALAVLDPLAGDHPLAPMPHLARARVLRVAGREGEAAAAMERFGSTAPEGEWRRAVLAAWSADSPGDGEETGR